MDKKRKQMLTIGAAGLAALVVLYVVYKRSQSTAGQPDAATLGQYAAVFRGNGVGGGAGYVYSSGATSAGNDSAGNTPIITSVPPPTPRPSRSPIGFPGGRHPGPDPRTDGGPFPNGGPIAGNPIVGTIGNIIFGQPLPQPRPSKIPPQPVEGNNPLIQPRISPIVPHINSVGPAYGRGAALDTQTARALIAIRQSGMMAGQVNR